MIRLFVTDLDGTLLNEKHQLDQRILDSIDFVLDHDCYFAIATGRDMHPSHNEALDFGNRHMYTIAMNGARIFDWNRKTIYEKPIDPTFVYELAKSFTDLSFDYNGKEDKYTLASYETIYKRYHKTNYFGGHMDQKQMLNWLSDYHYDLTPEEIASHTIYKINGDVKDAKRNQQVHSFLDKYRDTVVNAPFRLDFFEITEKQVNKGLAIHQLANYLGLSDDEVAVYGDGGNDLDMLKMFKHSYAPSNAIDLVKAHASHVIGSNVDYSVPKHMEEIIRNNKK